MLFGNSPVRTHPRPARWSRLRAGVPGGDGLSPDGSAELAADLHKSIVDVTGNSGHSNGCCQSDQSSEQGVFNQILTRVLTVQGGENSSKSAYHVFPPWNLTPPSVSPPSMSMSSWLGPIQGVDLATNQYVGSRLDSLESATEIRRLVSLPTVFFRYNAS